MTKRAHRKSDGLTVKIVPLVGPDEDGFNVDAECECGWTWMGWSDNPRQAGGSATSEWNEHLITYP